MRPLKTVIHVHTDYSHDSNSSPEDIVAAAERSGVGCVAVTDHETIAGAQAVAAAAAGRNLRVIIGEEISTQEGHLLGLFLHERIEPGLPARRTAEMIKRQGGLVIVPHPFNRMFGCGLCEHAAEIVDLTDAVEVCNAQNMLPFADAQAETFVERHRLIPVVGADVHHRGHFDACYQWVDPFEGPAGFLKSLKEARLVRGRHSFSYFVKAAHFVFREKTGLPLPRGYARNCTTPPPELRGRIPAFGT